MIACGDGVASNFARREGSGSAPRGDSRFEPSHPLSMPVSIPYNCHKKDDDEDRNDQNENDLDWITKV